MESKEPQMHVRYLGTRVCWTLPDERFYMGDREELTDDERKVCNNGGGYLSVSVAVLSVAR